MVRGARAQGERVGHNDTVNYAQTTSENIELVPLPEEIQHDLIAAIQAYASRPENKFSFNLNCEHDIDLKFLIKDKCTDCGNYMCTGVYINDWLVHSFKTVLQ